MKGGSDMLYPKPDWLSPTRRVFLVGSAAAFTAGCMNSQSSLQSSLRVGLSAYPPSFDPWGNFGTSAQTVKLQSFRGLASYGPDGSVRPELSESWVVKGGSVYEFKLRGDAKFHNGDKVTAHDVKFCYDRIGATNSGAYLQSFFATLKTDVIDDLNVRVTLPEPNATAIYFFASYDAPILSRRSIENDPSNPSGAGPYIMTRSERGAWIELEAFPYFYRPGLPKTKRVRFVAYPDESSRVAALESGDINLIEYVPALSMASIRKNAQLALDSTNGPATAIFFNCVDGPFKDPRVRRAVGYAVDRKAVVNGAFAGEGAPCGPLPISPYSEFFDPKMGQYAERDLEKARALLAEAGYPNGLRTTLLATSTYSVHRDPAIVIQQNLADAGIHAELSLPDWPTRVQLSSTGQYHILVGATTTENNDPSMFRILISSKIPNNMNRSWSYKNDLLDKLFEESLQTFDNKKRKIIFDRIGEEFVKDPAFVGVCFRPQAYARSTEVKGFTNLPGYLSFYSGITLENVSIG